MDHAILQFVPAWRRVIAVAAAGLMSVVLAGCAAQQAFRDDLSEHAGQVKGMPAAADEIVLSGQRRREERCQHAQDAIENAGH